MARNTRATPKLVTPPEDETDEYAIPAEESQEAKSDDFDNLEDFALSQSFDPGVEEEDPPVTCRKPPRDDFFRVRPGDENTMTVGIWEPPDTRDEVYLVKPLMFPLFGNLVSPRQLFVCKTSLGVTFLWAARMPREGRRRGGGDKYNATALKAAEHAKTRWTRMASDETLRCYRVFHPKDENAGQFVEPDWSATPPLLELIRRAFGDGYMIGSPDHPEARKIRGAIK
jgi:hypothetical protein